jgi:hypothetical protein
MVRPMRTFRSSSEQTLGSGRWLITHAGDGARYQLAGELRCTRLAGAATPYVLAGGAAYVLDPRASILDSLGRLVWDGRPLDPKEVAA